jgi:hypothetical protein
MSELSQRHLGEEVSGAAFELAGAAREAMFDRP